MLKVVRVEVWAGRQALVGSITYGVNVPTVVICVGKPAQTDTDRCQAAIQLHRIHTATSHNA